MSAKRRRCNRCGCEQPTTEDWDEFPEGGGIELCWDSGGPGCHDTRDERLVIALARAGELEAECVMMREALQEAATLRAVRPPRRRLVVTVEIGADDWPNVVRALRECWEWADRKEAGPDGPERIDMCTGGCDAGYTVSGSLDPSVTHDSYFEAVERWKAERDKERPAGPRRHCGMDA